MSLKAGNQPNNGSVIAGDNVIAGDSVIAGDNVIEDANQAYMPNSTVTKSDINLDQASKAWSKIAQAERIGIISHRHPDPDTVGSNLALSTFLKKLGKQVNSFCVDKPPYSCHFLSESLNFSSLLDPAQFDLLISVDCGSSGQVGYDKIHPELFQKDFINIDHHASNENFGTINIVQTNLSSTCEIVFNLLKLWQAQITPQIATYLLVGLYYDTGSFMHSSTTSSVLEMAENLLQCGANKQLIIRNLYHNFTEEKFHLWGKTLERIKITDKNSAVAVVDHEEMQEYRNSTENLSGVIDYISMTKECDFAVMISEEKTGQIKGSLRTRLDHINLSELAGQMGGGGHKKASGFGFPGKLSKEISWKIITPQI